MIHILYKFYIRNLHLLHTILFVVFLKFVISVEPFLETILLKLMDLFFFGCHCLFYVKDNVWPSLKSFFIFYAIFIVTKLYLIWSNIFSCCLIFLTRYKIRIKIVLLLLFTFYFVIVQVLEMANSGTLVHLYLVNYYRVHWLGSETFPRRIVIHEKFP